MGRYPVSRLAETNALGSLDVAILARGEFVSILSHTGVTFDLDDGRTEGFARPPRVFIWKSATG